MGPLGAWGRERSGGYFVLGPKSTGLKFLKTRPVLNFCRARSVRLLDTPLTGLHPRRKT
jgi:hypothetical protein